MRGATWNRYACGLQARLADNVTKCDVGLSTYVV